MKRVDTTVLAKVMLCYSGVKVVDSQSIFTRKDLKVSWVDPTVKGAFAAAVGAVAFCDAREISLDLEGYPPAMTGSSVAFQGSSPKWLARWQRLRSGLTPNFIVD